MTTGADDISSKMLAFASAISLMYSNSLSLYEPACRGAIILYNGARMGVMTFETDRKISVGGVHKAYVSYKYLIMTLLSGICIPEFGSIK